MNKKGKHILIVEDNKDLLSLLGGLFSSRGYTVICMDSLESALDYCGTEDFRLVDIALTDFMLKGATAEGLTLLIREKNPGARVIVMSAGTADLKDRLESLYVRKAIDIVIGKPFEIKTLAKLIERYAGI